MKKYIYLFFLLITTQFLSFAQGVFVSGKITQKNGQELIGATVLEKGTNNGAISDFNGNYEFTVSSNKAIIVVSYIGYISQEIAIDEKEIINIVLEEDAVSLNAVEVSGFIGVVGKSRKRVKSIQKVPESVSALNAEGIKKTGVTDIISFSNLVPNLKFNTSQAVGINFITVRGIPQIRGGDAPVAFVIDGVTVADPSLLSQELYDLALIEVVKGPQGAIYGKNAIGGAINIYTQDPTNNFSNKIKIGYGNGNSLLGQFISSGAIVKDKLYYRLSTQYKQIDGLLINQTLNRKVDFREDFNIRAQIKAEFSSRFKLSAIYQHFNFKGGATYYSVNPTGNIFDPNTPGGILDPNPKDGNNIIVSDRFGESTMENNNGTIKLDYSTKAVEFQSITSYYEVYRTTDGDLDFLEFNNFTQYEKTSTTTFNQEFRVQNSKTTSKFDWNVGGFYQNVKEPFYQDGLVRDFETFEQFNFVAADIVNITQTIALFGFVDYKLIDKLTLSAGFRFDIDKFEQEDLRSNTTSNRNNNEFQPKVSIAYQANEDILIFANYGRGYRTGGFNPAVTDLFNRDFEDETTDNYELGFKGSFWKNRFIFNVSGFYTKFNNQQQFILDLVDFFAGIYNYEESEIIGFEVDSRLRISKFLDIIANYGFTDATIITGGLTGGSNRNTTDNNQYNGNKTPLVPVDNFGIGLESNFPVTNDLKFNGFINLNRTGTIYWHESNLVSQVSDPYYLLDARISLEYKKWELALFGRNLFDTQYYQEFYPGEFVGSPEDIGWRGQPLTFGANISVKL